MGIKLNYEDYIAHKKEITRRKTIRQKEYLKMYRSTLEYKARRSEQLKNKRLNDPLFAAGMKIRSLIYASFKKKGVVKEESTIKILGCTIDDFKEYIESYFEEGMSWDNKGKWHLDHIIPLSLASTQEQVIRFNHYTNFQPLWAKDNLSKGATWKQ